MPLVIGSRLGSYIVSGTLGAGGMGEVYRANDSRLGRDVALKTLPEEFAGDADRMARFEREARVLASLNHPHIAALYGIEEADGVRALVMELVEGPTLEDRLRDGPLALEDAVKIARQVADALEYAHEHNVVHRDLKPANVKVTPEGMVKVLDFGLAKAAEARETSIPVNSPTLTMRATQAGVILGTAGYMSPEQASGKPVDKRSDVWSFGVLLFEMLTGKALFGGETLAHTMADVLRADVPFDRRRCRRICGHSWSAAWSAICGRGCGISGKRGLRSNATGSSSRIAFHPRPNHRGDGYGHWPRVSSSVRWREL